MPVSASVSWSAKLLARLLSPEGLLGFTGCAMATASGSFALYMMVNAPDKVVPTGQHYFTVFAGQQARAHRELANTSLPAGLASDEIDPVVTGSIPDRAAAKGGGNAAGGKPILSNVILRQVDGDSALVEMNDNLGVYKIGDIIPGAGRLVAMTQQNGHLALETSTGIILEGQ